MPRQVSPEGVALIQAFEGCHEREGDRFRPYVCPGGVLTIGWGHTPHQGRPFDVASRWTQDECDAALRNDLQAFGEQVAGLVDVPLTQGQFDALVSFAYNVGLGNLRGSTLLRKLNAGDAEGAALEFHRWNRARGQVMPGLVRRRAAEALRFQGLVDLDFDGHPDPMPQAVSESPQS